MNLKGLKCLKSLFLSGIDGLDRIEGLEGLKNLSLFYWFHSRRCVGGDMEFPASLTVLKIRVDVWLSPNVVARCINLRMVLLDGIRADNLDLSNCSLLQTMLLVNARVQKLQFLSGPITGRCASSLQFPEVSCCETLAEIPGLDQLIGLERLVLND